MASPQLGRNNNAIMATAATAVSALDGTGHSLVDSKFPVFLPYHKELYMSDIEFNAFVDSLPGESVGVNESEGSESVRLKDVGRRGKKRNIDSGTLLRLEAEDAALRKSPFMDALTRSAARSADADSLAAENKTLTENADVAYLSTKSALVDAFYELEGSIGGDRLERLLNASWAEDPLATLKILFNVRSIHLGKSNRTLAYQAFGWLYQKHPKTLLSNLVWLVRPVIEKKIKKGGNAPDKSTRTGNDEEDDIVFVNADEAQEPAPNVLRTPDGVDIYDIRNGVSHGYWKDLLNILSLAASDELNTHKNGRSMELSQTSESVRGSRGSGRGRGRGRGGGRGRGRVTDHHRDWDHAAAAQRKVEKLTAQHERVATLLETDPKYRALHFTIARLFAKQLKQDCDRLKQKKESRLITYIGKWAPSPKEAHDQHTFIVSSIAEVLHSHDSVCPNVVKSDREVYLKHAREAYRRLTISPLRKQLQVVERDITAKTFHNIDYQSVPSLAMRHHQKTFIRKDFDRFQAYTEKVADGAARTSGAILLPSMLVRDVRTMMQARPPMRFPPNPKPLLPGVVAQNPTAAIKAKLADGQWKTLVQRMRDSGTLKSSIAVCDVSGSMEYPAFSDGTHPMDSAIGLSLLLAEICEPPFGGSFITFSETPKVQKVGGIDDHRSLLEKVHYMAGSEWGGNTDFVAVFEHLILPLAVQNEIAPEDMVQQVFVFSDMQFDAAQGAYSYNHYEWRDQSAHRWSTSYERIKKLYAEAGYEMPQLIFWNLAGGRSEGKPVTKDDVGTALVSGYSQGQLKMFLDGGSFEEPEQEELVHETEVEGMDGDTLTDVKVKKEKPKMDPLAVVRKAISHPAYAMLKVVD